MEKRPLKSKTADRFVLFAVLMLASFVAGFAIASHHYTSMAGPMHIWALADNTVLFVVSGDINAISPLVDFAEQHSLRTAVWDIDDPPAYIRLGDRNIPLTPPVISLPTYICKASDANTIIGFTGTDINVFKYIASRCAGYVGPEYVRDENTGMIVEVNAE